MEQAVACSSSSDLSVLVIARAYPPVTGGMERFAAELVQNLAPLTRVQALTNGRGKKFLPLFIPYAAAEVCRIALTQRVDHIHLCDALLAPLGVLLKAALRVPVSVSVHGLDLTYANRFYQNALKASLGRLDLVVAGSDSTRRIAIDRISDVEPILKVINYGVRQSDQLAPNASLPADLAPKLAKRQMILTVGRLIRRKGVRWFVSEVLPLLPDETVYLVVGEGPERESIERAAAGAGVTARLVLAGSVDDVQLAQIYRRADIFVMPNIVVPSDVEGFGLVALEASLAGLPVVAARLEGITDAVRDGKNGILVDAESGPAFAEQIRTLLAMPKRQRTALGGRFRDYTRSNYSWSGMAGNYLEAFESLHEARLASLSSVRAAGQD